MIKLTLILALTIIPLYNSANAETCSNLFVSTSKNIDELREELEISRQEILRSRTKDSESLMSLSEQRLEVSSQINVIVRKITELEARMSWKEKNLFDSLVKIFGGNVILVKRHIVWKKRLVEHQKVYGKLSGDIMILRPRSNPLDAEKAQLMQVINSWLIKNNEAYRELKEVEDQMSRLICKGNACMAKISETVDAVQTALNFERADVLFKGSAISAASTYTNSRLKNYLDETNSSVTEYRSGLDQLNVQHKLKNDFVKPGDKLDLFLDVFLRPNIDILSIFNTFKLAEVRNELTELNLSVNKIQNQLTSQKSSVDKKIDEILCRYQDICGIK